MNNPLTDASRSNLAPRCILHIGTEKTGTSSIQHFLSKNRSALKRDGVVYPGFTGANGGSQLGFVAAVADRPWQSDVGARLGLVDQTDTNNYRERLIASIDEELTKRREAQTLLVSSEHFHSRLDTPELIQALKDLLSRWALDFRIIVYFRRQDRVAISYYSTKLKSGLTDPEVFPPNNTNELPYYYDYGRIFDNWANVFGTGAMVPGLFEQEELIDGDLINDFCEKAGLRTTGMQRPGRLNESLSDRGVLMLRELNRQWPQVRRSPRNPARERLVSLISKRYPGKTYPVSRQEAMQFFGRFRDSNRQLMKQAFPGRQGPLFSNDFSDYPIQVQRLEIPVDQDVRRLIDESKARSQHPPASGTIRPIMSWAGKVRVLLSAGASRLARARFAAGRQLPPLFLHVGLPKTATTTLQNTLFAKHSGLYYLGKSSHYGQPKGCRSEQIYKALAPLLWKRDGVSSPRQARSQLLDHLVDVGDRPLLGSWEGLGVQRRRRFEDVVVNTERVFSDLRLIFTLRNPLTRITSSYLYALKACALDGKHHSLPAGVLFLSFEDWLYRGQSPDGHDYRFVFGENLRFAVDHLGVDRVGVFLLEDLQRDPRDFFESIATFLGIDIEEARAQEQKHLNPALTVEHVALLQQISASASDLEQWRALTRRERKRRLDEIRLTGSGEKYRVPLSDEQKAYIVGNSQALNRWIVETFKIDLERHGYPL